MTRRLMINHEDESAKLGLQVMKTSLQKKHRGDTCYGGNGVRTRAMYVDVVEATKRALRRAVG